MAYTPHTWQTGELITSAGLNNLEEGAGTGVTAKDVADACDIAINSLHETVNYGYDHPADASTQTVTSVKRRGTRVTINANLAANATALRVSLTMPGLEIYAGAVSQDYPTYGLKLQDGHTYRIRAHYVSGSATQEVRPRFFNGSNGSPLTNASTHSVDPATGDLMSRFTYSAASYPDGVHAGFLIARADTGNTLVNYTIEVTVEDITAGAPELVWGNIAPVESAAAGASRAVGDLIIFNRRLYKVTAAIAVGETLTPGTNISATTVAALLAELRALIL